MSALLAIGALSGDRPSLAQSSKGGNVDWYVPKEGDFRPEYVRDKANQKVQTWIDYWGWVGSFYRGNLVADGWTKQGQGCVAGVKSAAKRRELTEQFNDLGKLLAKEWSKDKTTQKINTADLTRWGRSLLAAQEKDRGTGQGVEAIIKSTRAEALKKLGR